MNGGSDVDELGAREGSEADPTADADVIGVVGVGHIGGSIVKRSLAGGRQVVVLDADPAACDEARRSGAEVVDDLADLAARADLVAVAIAPSSTVDAWRSLSEAPRSRPGRLVVIDVASVKRPLLERLAPRGDAPWTRPGATFALTHPMAGRETSGWAAAIVDLFEGAAWLVCPHPGLHGDDLRRILAFIGVMGARPGFFAADRHDRFAALVSHLPHLLAFCYQDLIDDVDPTGNWQRFGGGSLADLLRVADADPVLWAEILAENRPELDTAIDELAARLRAGFVPRAAPQVRPPDPVQPLTMPLDAPLAGSTIDALVRAGDQGFEVADSEVTDRGLVLRFDRRPLR